MRLVRTDIMGMPIIVEIVDAHASAADFDAVFDYFTEVDRRFSPYLDDSEVSRLNRGEVLQLSSQMHEVLTLAEQTKQETEGFFDMRRPSGRLDPSGVVKGWAICEAAQFLEARGVRNFYIDVGGDIQTRGRNSRGEQWRIGVRNPFNREEIVKVLEPRGGGVATSGSAARGAHIYNPHAPGVELGEVLSITVIGRDILEADRFATAAFAMGPRGIEFIESAPGLEAYHIDAQGKAMMTSGFNRYTV